MLRFKQEKSSNLMLAICFPILMLTFDDFSSLKQSICAYLIALKNNYISSSPKKTYYRIARGIKNYIQGNRRREKILFL